MLAEHPCELYADFRQYYGADLDELRGEIGEIRTADLAAQLPSDSRTFRAINPELEWTARDYMLWSIEYSLRILRWQPTKDGRAGRNQPRPMPTPQEFARVRKAMDSTNMEYIAEQLGIDLNQEGVDG